MVGVSKTMVFTEDFRYVSHYIRDLLPAFLSRCYANLMNGKFFLTPGC